MSKRLSLLLTLILSLLLVSKMFPGPFQSPGSYFFADQSDGVKNYYTLMYYLRHDKGSHFSGMNYPYGELLVFADAQPALAFLMKCAGKDMSAKVPLVLNAAMLLSPVVCALFLLLIFRHYKFRNLYAVCFSVLIACLSPQMLRYMGHYALVYAFFPMIWYFCIKVFDESHWLKWLLLIAVSLFMIANIHMYHFMMSLIFVLAYGSIYLLMNRNRQALLRVFSMLSVTLGVFALIMFVNVISDPVHDRPSIPWGFFYYYTSGAGLFLPSSMPDLLKFFKVNIDHGYSFEGRIYLGVIPILFGAMITLITLIGLRKEEQRGKLSCFLKSTEGATLLASILLLFFAMALPFRWNLQFILDYISLIKQFRSPGRFAWVFYYVFTVFSVLLVHRYFEKRQGAFIRLLTHFVLIASIVLWTIDLWNYYGQLRKSIRNKVANEFLKPEYEEVLKRHGIKSSDFQAMVPIPYFFIGSEKLGGDRLAVFYEACRCSYETGLPMTTAALSRTGISQALNCASLLSDPILDKAVLKDYPDQRPLLILCNRGEMNAEEKYYCSRAQLIDSLNGLLLYSLPLKAFVPEDSIPKYYYSLWKQNKSSIQVWPDSLKDQVKYNDLLSAQREVVMHREGPFQVFAGKIPSLKKGSKLHVSLWFYVNPKTEAMPLFSYELYSADGKLLETQDFTPAHSSDVADGFVRLSESILVQDPDGKISILAKGKGIEVKDFLLFPDGATVLVPNPNGKGILFNNFPLSLERLAK